MESEPEPPACCRTFSTFRSRVDQDTINALLLQDLGVSRLQTEHNQARIEAALSVLRAIRAAHDNLYPQLKVLADKQIQHLEAVAALDTTDVMTLVRAGDHKGAQFVAEVDVVAAELDAIYSLRDGYVVRGGSDAMRVGSVDASRWRDPERPGRGNSIAEQFLNGLHRGNTLWFPTPAEAVATAQPVYDKLQRKAEQAAQVRRNQNRNAAAFAG